MIKDMPQKDLEKYCRMAKDRGATDAITIHPDRVVTAPWVLIKCQFGCPDYGRGYCCPPHTHTYDRTRAILDSYGRAILFRIEAPATEGRGKRYKDYMDMLVELEGTLFKDGYYKALVVLSGSCIKCKKCGILTDNPCVNRARARPSMEACGIDVFQTARNNGFFIKTLKEKEDTHNDYCLMLVD